MRQKKENMSKERHEKRRIRDKHETEEGKYVEGETREEKNKRQT